MYTGWNNPIYMNYVSSNTGSNMDFHANTSSYWTGTSASTDTLASTKWFAGDGNSVTNEYEVPISSWWYAEIHINNDNFLQDWFTNDAAQGTIYHEMGHAFGLSDSTDFYSIMARYPYRQVQTIQYGDNQGIVNLYGL